MRTRVQSLASLIGLRIQHCLELQCRSQMQLGSNITVAVVQACRCSSHSVPSLGTSYATGVTLKSKKKKKKERNLGVPTVVQWVKDSSYLCEGAGLTPGPTQWLKDLLLPQLWYRLPLHIRFNPWPRNFHVPHVQLKKKKERKVIHVIRKRVGAGFGLAESSGSKFIFQKMSLPSQLYQLHLQTWGEIGKARGLQHSVTFFSLKFPRIPPVRFPLGHILFLELQKKMRIILHPFILLMELSLGQLPLRHMSCLGRSGYLNKVKILWRRRRREEGSLGRQPAVFTTQGILETSMKRLDIRLITWEAMENFS